MSTSYQGYQVMEFRATYSYGSMLFITNRSHCVRINSHLSSYLLVLSGVPHGSVLWLILFNLFINDITDHLSPDITIKLYADDLKMYTQLTSMHSTPNFQKHLDVITDWSDTWQIKISYHKCNNQRNASYRLSNSTLQQVTSVKDLGIYFQHIKDIISRAKRRSALIFRCFLSRHTSSLLKAYTTYVRPLAEYASTVWSLSTIMLINDLESIQKTATKRLPGLKSKFYTDRLTATRLQSLEHRRLITDLILCFKISKGFSSIKLNSMTFSLILKIKRHESNHYV